MSTLERNVLNQFELFETKISNYVLLVFCVYIVCSLISVLRIVIPDTLFGFRFTTEVVKDVLNKEVDFFYCQCCHFFGVYVRKQRRLNLVTDYTNTLRTVYHREV